MSRIDQSVGSDLVRNPTSRFFSFKNYFTQEEIVVKGKTKEVKVFDRSGFTWSTKEDDKWINHDFELPIEFALLNGDWVNFKGYNESEKTMYFSTEVKDADSVISVSNKDGIVYEFTLNQMWGKVKGSSVKNEEGSKAVKAKLKQLGVKQHSSVYAAIRKDDGEFELVNFQLKGANLSGSREKENQPSGWWNVSKEFKKSKKIYTHWIQMNDWITESGELGEYGVVNFTLGDKIDAEDNEKIEVLFEELEAYHKYYLNKGKEAEPVVEAIEEDPSAIYNENGEKLF